jgi:hypothetical protein
LLTRTKIHPPLKKVEPNIYFKDWSQIYISKIGAKYIFQRSEPNIYFKDRRQIYISKIVGFGSTFFKGGLGGLGGFGRHIKYNSASFS